MKTYYNAKDFGAKADGVTKDTKAIQEAINLCNKQGGGTVLLEEGTFVSGTLYLRSNVYIEIAVSAKLLASPNIEDYGADTHYNRYRNEKDMDRCFIYAQEAENIGFYGHGEINGNAEAFPNEGSIYRPMMIRLLRCSHIHISDLKLYDSAAWTIAFLDSCYIWTEGLDICNEKRYNGDGLDFDGCSHVFVNNCRVKGTDDNLCLQASSKLYPVKNIHISNCEFTSICAAIRIGLKSIGSISEVTIHNCTMYNVWREGIKLECTEGGNISDIMVSNIVMRNVRRPIYAILNNRFLPDGLGSSVELTDMPDIGTMKRILFSNIFATDDEEMKETHLRFHKDIMGSPRYNGIRMDAEDNHPIEQVMIDHLVYTTIGGVKREEIPEEYPEVLDQKIHPGISCSENYYPDWSRATFMDIRNVRGLSLKSVQFHAMQPDEREAVVLEKCSVLYKEITI